MSARGLVFALALVVALSGCGTPDSRQDVERRPLLTSEQQEQLALLFAKLQPEAEGIESQDLKYKGFPKGFAKYVIGEPLKVRAVPSNLGPYKGTIPADALVAVKDRRDDFFLVTGQGTEGWVAFEDLSEASKYDVSAAYHASEGNAVGLVGQFQGMFSELTALDTFLKTVDRISLDTVNVQSTPPGVSVTFKVAPAD